MSTLLLNRRGPYTFLLKSGLLLPEGELYEAGIKLPDASVYEFVVAGGHDGQNKIASGTGQTSAGKPSYQLPAGCLVYDTQNQYFWQSNGWNGGAPANGLDEPSVGMITAANFLGWTALQPGSSGSGGGTSPGTVDGGTWV